MSGLKEGDKVVADTFGTVEEGMKVTTTTVAKSEEKKKGRYAMAQLLEYIKINVLASSPTSVLLTLMPESLSEFLQITIVQRK